MDQRHIWAILLSIAVPLILWSLAAVAARWLGRRHAFLAFVGGSDGRLSLSRLQATLWTLVIFGAYAGAMVVSTVITVDKWISIPTPLLELAGISLATGVFSSLIATTTGEEKSARASKVAVDVPDAPTALVVTGSDFGKDGSVRVGTKRLALRSWTESEIIADLPSGLVDSLRTDPATTVPLILDTANGKVCYPLGGSIGAIKLGQVGTCYEFADLFRDDKSPSQLDLMKFQMFGWTLVAVVGYVVLFYVHLGSITNTLPTVDQTIALLTGISQAGYLTGKAVTS